MNEPTSGPGFEPGVQVHILFHGAAYCGMPGIPGDWPEGHRWVSKLDRKDATCPGCIGVVCEKCDGDPTALCACILTPAPRRKRHWLWAWWDRGYYSREVLILGFVIGSVVDLSIWDVSAVVIGFTFLSSTTVWVRK